MKNKRRIFLILFFSIFTMSCSTNENKEIEKANIPKQNSELVSNEINSVISSKDKQETESNYSNSITLEVKKGKKFNLQYEGIIKKENGLEQGTVNNILIYDQDTLLQKITVNEMEGIGEDMLLFGNMREDAIVMEDINFDGYKDFYVLAFQDSYLNSGYYLFIWDKEKENFMYIGGIIEPEIDQENQEIISDWRGRNVCGRTYYKINNHELIKVRDVIHEWNSEDEIIVKIHENSDGEWTLISEEKEAADRFGEFED